MREYEYVSAIAREGTLSGAAVQLGISQPALTRFLQKEEGELGTALFQRIDNRMVLTYAGECYLEHIKQIFAIQAHMRAALDDITRMDRGRLRVGITGIRRPFTIFSVIPQFKKKYPSIDLTLNEFASDKLEEMLEGLELDCIAVNVTKKRDCFEYLPVAREEYVLAVHKDHPLVQAAERSDRFKYPVVRPGQLEGCSFVMLGKAHRIRQFADSILDGNRIGHSISMQSRTLDGALEAVANDLGCTFTPEIMLSYIRGARNIRCLSLDTPGTGYEFSLLYRKGAYLPPSTQDFLEMFRSAFRSQRENEAVYE
ncbi:MAG: LysR family transcriptional regulator [Lawsonibacter sp.]|nr:LysR family transcriptional regulator [Lawsonibacter sp.]MCI9654913.1 LysR family transcriptional regulator [Lawsonibacter sp.]